MRDATCTGVHWPAAAVVDLLATLVACKGDEPPPTVPRPQIAGENVNMVSGTKWLDGEPFLQRQNEPSLAVSSVNPEHLLVGANDYRTVDVPFPFDADDPTIKETGDAWLGLFKSLGGGRTWKSGLVPGYQTLREGKRCLFRSRMQPALL